MAVEHEGRRLAGAGAAAEEGWVAGPVVAARALVAVVAVSSGASTIQTHRPVSSLHTGWR